MNDEQQTAKPKPIDLKPRTKQFALRVIRMYSSLPATVVAQVLGKQVLRSGTSIGAHYREAIRGRSDAEMLSLFEGALKEIEETEYWFELLVESDTVPEERMAELMREVGELNAIFTASARTLKKRLGRL